MQECKNMKVREAHVFMVPSKCRQRLTINADQMPAKSVWAVREIYKESESGVIDADSSGSDAILDRRNVYLATAADRAQKPEDLPIRSEKFEQERQYDRGRYQTV